jgi:hypothetical protein
MEVTATMLAVTLLEAVVEVITLLEVTGRLS